MMVPGYNDANSRIAVDNSSFCFNVFDKNKAGETAMP